MSETKTDTAVTLADFPPPPGQFPSFSTNLAPLPPEYGRLIAELMSAYSLIDVGQSAVFGAIFNTQAAVAVFVYHELIAEGAQTRRMVRAAAKGVLTEDQYDYFEAIQEMSRNTPRNDMAHGMWAHSSHVADAGILLVPPQQWIGIHGAGLAGAQGATFNAAGIKVYSAEILEKLARHVMAIVDAWLMLAAWIRPEAAPVKFDKPEEKLRTITPLTVIVQGKQASRRARAERESRKSAGGR